MMADWRATARRTCGSARARRIILSLLGLAVAALALRSVSGGGRQLAGAAARLSQPRLGWLALAVGAEVLSYLLYASAQRRMLGRCRHGPGVIWLASLAVSAQSLSNFLPAGYVAANLLNFRELRRRGMGPVASGQLLLASSGLYIGALACLTLIAAEVAGSRGGALSWIRFAAGAALGVIVVLFLAARWLVRRRVLRLPSGWRSQDPVPCLSGRAVGSAGILFAGSWVADSGCLIAAAAAVGTSLSWMALPIAYCAAQLVSFLPLTPGGVGLVEGSLALTLVAEGGGAGYVLAATLLYRIISYWGTLPAGAVGYWLVRRGHQTSTSLDDDGGLGQDAGGDRPLGADRPLVMLEG